MTNFRMGPRKKKTSKKRLFLRVFLILIVLMVASTGAYAYWLTKKAEEAANNAYDKDNTRIKSELRETQVEPMTDNVSILFIGIDDSEKREQGSNHSRSDALLLATLNNKTKSVKLLSIPRDSYAYIPYVGYQDKITHAHAFGGTNATIDTVENMLNVPVDYYYRLNFDAFIEIVDALDGVQADVPYALHELDENDKRTVNLKPGLQTLNGREALALARTRKQDSDIKRGERQQMILEAILKKASSVTSFTKYDDLLAAVGNNMKTNMTFNEMKSFFEYIKGGMPNVESLALKGDDDMSTGIYYYKLNETELVNTQNTLRKQLGLTDSDPSNAQDSTADTNSSGGSGGSGYKSNYNSDNKSQ
ncbi:LCP family protein [Viridibacillus sp. YIM B01967]|uniref:LCP family protein n=1 Tax=Viridibacillus soli TaxID=2798301 RepID=A0ABS1H5W8_9BACL|nr:LCP family protein [Viridibacillus soli]MBK3494814.1 LCP family protein [Viridibacillus soli]